VAVGGDAGGVKCSEATQRAGIVGQIGRAASLQARQAARATTRMEDIVERGYVIIGSPDEVVEQLTELATDPQCRPPDAADAVRQHGQGPRRVQHQAIRRPRIAKIARPVLRMGRPLVAATDDPQRARRGAGLSGAHRRVMGGAQPGSRLSGCLAVCAGPQLLLLIPRLCADFINLPGPNAGY
jgi:hypothetical protein